MNGRCTNDVILGGEHVCARDRKQGRALLGGLGAMGVGHMWFDDEDYMSRKPDWDDAPEVSAPPAGQAFAEYCRHCHGQIAGMHGRSWVHWPSMEVNCTEAPAHPHAEPMWG